LWMVIKCVLREEVPLFLEFFPWTKFRLHKLQRAKSQFTFGEKKSWSISIFISAVWIDVVFSFF
jgi:hypothetical protein